MNRMGVETEKVSLTLRLPITVLFFVLLCATAANAKMAIDFNPNLDFSKYKTLAYIGGVESHVRLQLNPELLNNRMHRAVVRQLTAKGLREVQLEENPDLVVRYWVEAESNAQVTGTAHWGGWPGSGRRLSSLHGFLVLPSEGHRPADADRAGSDCGPRCRLDGHSRGDACITRRSSIDASRRVASWRSSHVSLDPLEKHISHGPVAA